MSVWADLPTAGTEVAAVLRKLADQMDGDGGPVSAGELVEFLAWLDRWAGEGFDRTEASYHALQRRRTALGRAAQIERRWWLDPVARFALRLPVALAERRIRTAQRELVAAHTTHMAAITDIRIVVLDHLDKAADATSPNGEPA